MRITREQLRRWGACYTDEHIAALVPEDGLTPIQVAALDIQEKDRLWVLLREEVIPARELRLLACDWAEAACRAADWSDERSLEVIAVARRHAVGEAAEAELVAAGAEAWSALSAAWSSSARSAAARAAARASAWLAAAPAAWAAEKTAAAWSAYWATARSVQLADVVRVISG